MTATDIRRRSLLRLAAGALVYSAMPAALARGLAPTVISAANDGRGNHYLCGWRDSQLLFKHAIDERAHDCAYHHQRGEILFFARRPGTHIHILDARSGEIRQAITSPAGSHFYGHGCLSRDGATLYVTENDVTGGGAGRIALYDCRDHYRRLGSFASGGIGPHQLAMLPDDKTLVVANGGILTLPEHGRSKLNLDSMQPNLSYFDRHSGALLGSWQPPHHQLSLRHLAVTGDASVIVGAQFQGSGAKQWPLVFSHRLGQTALQPLLADTGDWRRQHNYIASIAVANERRQVLTTSPRGGTASLWDLDNNQLLQHFAVRDVAGAAYDPRRAHFVVSNGHGQLLALTAGQEHPSILDYSAGLQWDNHLRLTEV